MKWIKISLLCFCFLFLSSCDSKTNTGSGPLTPVSTIPSISATSNASDNSNAGYQGIYKFEYEDNSETLIEDHYIVIEEVNGKLTGRYYGTSDDFDVAREGYLPGFYVSEMRDMQIKDNVITFNIQLNDSDVFSKPVDQNYKSASEVPLDKNPKWIQFGLRKHSRDYKGKLINGVIQLEADFGPRVFKKVVKIGFDFNNYNKDNTPFTEVSLKFGEEKIVIGSFEGAVSIMDSFENRAFFNKNSIIGCQVFFAGGGDNLFAYIEGNKLLVKHIEFVLGNDEFDSYALKEEIVLSKDIGNGIVISK
jgi:hypothetical protein